MVKPNVLELQSALQFNNALETLRMLRSAIVLINEEGTHEYVCTELLRPFDVMLEIGTCATVFEMCLMSSVGVDIAMRVFNVMQAKHSDDLRFLLLYKRTE